MKIVLVMHISNSKNTTVFSYRRPNK